MYVCVCVDAPFALLLILFVDSLEGSGSLSLVACVSEGRCGIILVRLGLVLAVLFLGESYWLARAVFLAPEMACEDGVDLVMEM